MYSQNEEERVILEFFQYRSRGSFLDIGAADPFQLSNTRALYEKGFRGVLVEPAPSFVSRLQDAYGSDPDMQLLPLCVGDRVGPAVFYHSPDKWYSTTVESTTHKWIENHQVRFETRETEMVDVPELLRRCRYKTFDFISIDTEGNVLEILRQFDPIAIGCSLMCVEWNWQDGQAFEAYFDRFNFHKLYESPENLIYGLASTC